MPKVFLEYMEGENVYACRCCGTHLTRLSQLVSVHYRSQHGQAFLFDRVINVRRGPQYRKRMTSGVYTICDIFCLGCSRQQPIGWTYTETELASQIFKLGRFILSEALLVKENWNDDDEDQ